MKKLLTGFVIVVMSIYVTSVSAHHAFAMFDLKKTIAVEGKVKKLQWANPHVWLHVLVEQENGEVVEWAFEGQGINGMRRIGWTRNVVKPGDVVQVLANPARNGSSEGSMRTVTLSDGRVLGRATGGPPPTSSNFIIEGAD